MPLKLTKEQFIEKARSVHGDKYDYSKVEYINNQTKVCIICPKHGEFWQRPASHLQGQGCEECTKTHKSNTKEFIEKVKSVHGEKYDYSKVEYINNHTKVCIICPEHGEFWTTPMCLLRGSECPQCSRNSFTKKINKKKKKQIKDRIIDRYGEVYGVDKIEYKNKQTPFIFTCFEHGDFEIKYDSLNNVKCPKCREKENRMKAFENFKEKSFRIHGQRFNYNESVYINNTTPIKIYDTLKKEYFYQTPAHHLKCKGNPNEKNEKIRQKLQSTTEDFIEKAKSVHGDKYDYSKVKYVNNHTKVCIICPEHGEFWQTPTKHLTGQRCPKCSIELQKLRQSLTLEEFIEKACKVHGDKYDYSKVVYKNSTTPVCIICPEHGEFWQLPIVHTNGCGCKQCGNISIMENEIMKVLNDEHIHFEYQKRFKWLKNKKPLSLDFYLSEYNIAIECQGEQHYQPYDFFGGIEKFMDVQKRDELKKKLCNEHNIKILYYTKYNINGENIFKDKETLIQTIKSETEKGK